MTGRPELTHAPSLTPDQVMLLQAHHEAGHAVVAHHAGLQVNSLHVQRNSDTESSWFEGITYVVYLPRMATQFAVQAAAGEIAAIKWLDDNGLFSPETQAAANADHDRDETIDLLAEDGICIDWTTIQDAARNEVNGFWAQISAVAQAAAAKGDLTANQIIDVIQGAVDTRCFRHQHGTPETWTTADFETYEHLAEVDSLNAPTASAYRSAA